MKEKIAICTPGFAPVPAVKGGAVETLITYLIEENEKEHKYDIDLYTIYDDKIKNIKYKYTNIYTVKKNRLYSKLSWVFNGITRRLKLNIVLLDFLEDYVRKVRKHKYDKIIIENNMILYKKIYKNYKYKTKFYYHQHNNMDEPGKTKYYAKFISKTAEEIMFVSNNVKEAFNKATNTSVGKVFYNCVDFEKFDVKINGNRKKYREKLKLGDNEFNFLFSGRICSDKGIMELYEAFLKLNKKYPNVTLSIIGADFSNIKNKYQNKLIEKCKNTNIKIYEFMKYDKLIKYIVSADCIVIPSIYNEAFGVVALEAMAMKKAIIATRAGGLTEPLANNSAVIIDRENIVENLYNSMEKIYLNKKYAEKIAANAYERVCSIKEFNKNNYFKNFINFIN